jgi:hypothetical protein
MNWEVCVQYANGSKRVLFSYKNRETALKCIDAIYYTQGYPMHLAYVVRQTPLPVLQYA